MQLDLSTLSPLASAVETAGAPILAQAIRAAAPIVGAAVPIPGASLIIPAILNALADAVGGSADDPSTITTKIEADPSAAAGKIKAVEDAHKDDLQSLLDLSKAQVDQNLAELNITTLNWRDLLSRFFFAGWRPFTGWVFGISLALLLWSTWHGAEPPPAFDRYFIGATNIFMLLIGSRTTDKIFGVATNSLKQVASSGATAVTKAFNRLHSR
jgi:hypothetical protein